RIEGAISVDMQRVKQRKDAIAGASAEGVEKSLRSMEGCTVLEGHARFVDERRMRVGDETISAERVFINAGARAAIPKIRGLEQVPYLTNSTMMAVDSLPEHLV